MSEAGGGVDEGLKSHRRLVLVIIVISGALIISTFFQLTARKVERERLLKFNVISSVQKKNEDWTSCFVSFTEITKL